MDTIKMNLVFFMVFITSLFSVKLIVEAKDYSKLYKPRPIPKEIAARNTALISALKTIPMDYTYGKIDLIDKISTIKIYYHEASLGKFTYFTNFYRFGENIKSGSCVELYVMEAKKMQNLFEKTGLDKKYQIRIVSGKAPVFFDDKLKKVKGMPGLYSSLKAVPHYFIAISSKDDTDEFYRDPSFNMWLESTMNSGYKEILHEALIPQGTEASEEISYLLDHDSDGSDHFTTIGINDNNEMVYFSGWNDEKKVFYIAIEGEKEIEYFPLTTETLKKIKNKELEYIFAEILKKPILKVDYQDIPTKQTNINFTTSDWLKE